MFSVKLKILLLTLLFAVNHPVSVYASEEQEQTKKRLRVEDPGISSATSSSPVNSDDEAAGKPSRKAPKLKEDETSSSVQPASGIIPAQLSIHSHLSTINPSQDASSSPGTTFSTPQPARKYASLPVAAPSAAPSTKPLEEEEEPAEAKKVFTESRIKTEKLAYFYKDQYFDFTDWETETAKILRKVTDAIHKNPILASINIALAQLSIIYEIDSKAHKFDFMLPYFFMSRFPKPDDKKLIDGTLLSIFSTEIKTLTPEEKEKYNHYTSFHVGNLEKIEERPYYPQFRQHLKDIFSLSKSSLKFTRRNELDLPNVPRDFTHFYFHSEQAILIYLMQKKDEYLSQISPQIAKGATITTFLLNIISSNDMCQRCGDTFFRAIEGKNVTNIWGSLIKKEIHTIPPEGLRFFVACVGLQAYPENGIILRDNEGQEICSISSVTRDGTEEVGIDLLSYQYPTVAQHYLSAPKKESKS
ncbi:MAG: hypothetical protein BGO76_06630 [Caedibacter sp. 38-128]|nr:hypothetical protein [Holosporales bacterium]OJX02544.1 MAG: hypothetical protein BGO76_06630 [Caedibacter sp. 38-128]